MLDLRFTVDARQYERGLRRWLGWLSGETKEAVRRTGVQVQNEARRRCPVDTGRLRSSIVHTVEGRGRDFAVRVGTNVNYAAAVEYGTAPHVIVPTRKKALHWPGARHPVAKVNHPGTRAQPFMRPAMDLAGEFLRAEVARIRGHR